MSENLIAPIFALLGIIIGSIIPSTMKFMENKVEYSRINKEKHEMITRRIMADFIPKIDSVLFLARNYIKIKTNGKATPNLTDIVSNKIDDIEVYYQSEIKDYYPLEMHSKITEIISEMSKISFDILFDSIEDSSSNEEISKKIDECEGLIKHLVKHIEKNYI